MRFFDPHIHMTSRTTHDYEAMAAAGVRALIEPAFWLGQPRTTLGAFADYFASLVGWERFRAAQCAAMAPINAVARAHSLHVVEDAAQALGAKQNGKAACALGDIACVSFYPTKNLGAAGEAGLVATANPDLFERCRILRNQGMEPRYEHHYVGGNFRMDAIQGAVLGVKGRHLAEWNAKRVEHASLYDRLLGDASVTIPSKGEGNTHVYHQYTIRTGRRDELKSFLADRGVGSDVYYPIPLHLQPCLRDHGYSAGDFPVAERAAAEVLSLPIYPELTPENIEHVADCICRFSDDA